MWHSVAGLIFATFPRHRTLSNPWANTSHPTRTESRTPFTVEISNSIDLCDFPQLFQKITGRYFKSGQGRFFTHSLRFITQFCHVMAQPSPSEFVMLISGGDRSGCETTFSPSLEIRFRTEPSSHCPWSGVVRLANVGYSCFLHDAGQTFWLFSFWFRNGGEVFTQFSYCTSEFFNVLLAVHLDITVK